MFSGAGKDQQNVSCVRCVPHVIKCRRSGRNKKVKIEKKNNVLVASKEVLNSKYYNSFDPYRGYRADPPDKVRRIVKRGGRE